MFTGPLYLSAIVACHLVLALALQGAEAVIVDQLRHLSRSLLPQALHHMQGLSQML